MARDVTTINQTNLWGKQSDTGLGLEPQRNDLWLVDFTSARLNVAKATGLSTLTPILPQYVRSIAPPELRTKADAVRRDSIPFQMPSWDDPLDPIKIVFLMDSHEQDDICNVVNFLDAWLALTRAGHGSRWEGYNATPGWMTLNANYSVDCFFDVQLFLLRGAALNTGGFSPSSNTALQQTMTAANAAFRSQQIANGLTQTGQAVPPSVSAGAQTPTNTAATSQGAPFEQDMVIWSIYTLHNAWLGAYKVSDLNYAESGLVTVDATFYADEVRLGKGVQVTGEAVA